MLRVTKNKNNNEQINKMQILQQILINNIGIKYMKLLNKNKKRRLLY